MTQAKTNGGASGLLKALGPGILYAGAAIGVSHLYWSTRAGALYGFALIGFVILAHAIKYPCFEFCRRYTVATNESVLEGYLRVLSVCAIVFLLGFALLYVYSTWLLGP